jgi:hypothetical protein
MYATICLVFMSYYLTDTHKRSVALTLALLIRFTTLLNGFGVSFGV